MFFIFLPIYYSETKGDEVMSYSVGSFSSLKNSKAVTGLASGLDTDELIEQMTYGTRAKITKQLQNKQLAIWKQAAYREISTKMVEFENKYYKSTSASSNILNSQFYQVSTIKNSSSYVNVSGSSDVAANMVIRDIDTLAQKTGFTTRSAASTQTITTGKIESEWQLNLLQGASFAFEFNDQESTLKISSDFKFDAEADTDIEKLDAVLAELNTQIQANDAIKDKLSFSRISDGAGGYKVELSNNTSVPEDIKTIELKSGSSSILLSGLGLESGQSSGTDGIITAQNSADTAGFYEDKQLGEVLSGSSVTVSLNGIDKKITFAAADKALYSTPEGLKTYMQSAFNSAYGTNTVQVGMDANGALTLKPQDSSSILTLKSATASNILGVNGALHVKSGESNRLDLSKSLNDLSSELKTALVKNGSGNYEMSVNGIKFEFAEDTLFGDMLYRINNSDANVNISYISTTDTFSVTAKESGTNGKTEFIDSGSSNLATALFGQADYDSDSDGQINIGSGNYAVSAGKDARLEVSFDGGSTFQWINRSTNSFGLDGVSIELLGKAEGTAQENIKFTVANDIDSLYKKVEEFITDYNSIIELLSSKITEKQSSDEAYLPLTDEQKKEMTDDQIEDWEKEAKKGLLRNDQYLNNILSGMRSALNNTVKGTDLTLAKIGIATNSYSWEENGKLVIDSDKLKAALNENADGVMSLFLKQPDSSAVTEKEKTDQTGLAYRLQSLWNKNVNRLGEDGILIHLAGYVNDNSYDDNIFSDKIDSIDSILETLKRNLEMEETRYMNKFTALETYISNMNQQSQWLTQQFSS